MPRAGTPDLAHQFEKLAAAAADIEHVFATGEERPVELDGCAGHVLPDRESDRRTGCNRSPSSGSAECRGCAP